MSTKQKTAVIEKKEVDAELQLPQRFQVVLLNDDYTTMEFVVSVLIKFFAKKVDEAYQIMSQVHQDGKGVAGTYSRELAEVKCRQVMDAAKQHDFPLRCRMEAL